MAKLVIVESSAASPRITELLNILKRLMLPGPVVYEVVPSEVSGIMALSVPRTKNRLIFSLCSR